MNKKLSPKQYEIIETIRQKGRWVFPSGNCQNPTVKKMIALGICDFDSNYTALVLTDKGKQIEL